MTILPQERSTRGRHYAVAAVIATVVLIAAGLLIRAAIRATRARIDTFRSASNMRDLDGAIMMYANEHNGQFPPTLGDAVVYGGVDPRELIAPWGLSVPASGSTPEALKAQINSGGHSSYVYLGAGLTNNQLAPNTLILYEDDGSNPDGTTYCWFGDGHGETMTTAKLAKYVVAPLMAKYEKLERASTQPTMNKN